MKLICFDLDNTLVLSDKSHSMAYNKALNDFGFEKLKLSYISSLFGRPKEEVVYLLTKNDNKNFLNKFLKRHDYYLLKETKKYTNKIRNVDKTLNLLKKQYKLAVVSNCNHKNVKILLRAAKLNPRLFNVIIGYDDVKHSKPYPDEIIRAQHLVHNKADFMVGDTIYDILAGKRARVKTIAVLTGHHSKSKLLRYNPDYLIKDVNELPKLLKEINNH